MPSATTSTRPTIEPVASFPLELRQMITEDGRFVDIPKDLLRQPAPKPTEFLYFQHHYESPSSLRKDLKGCKTTEDAIDLLATELETMHALVSGYVKNLSTVTTRFDEDIAKVHQEHASLETNFLFCQYLLEHTNQVLTQLQYGYSLLKAKVELKVSQHSDLKKLPVIKPSNGRLHLIADPSMTPRQKAKNNDQANRIRITKSDSALVESTEAYGHEKAMVDELAHPELHPPKPSEKRKGTGETSQGGRDASPSFEPHVMVKVNKLTEGLETMRETFQRVQAKTEKEFDNMRFLSAAATQDANEFWHLQDNLSNRTSLEAGEWVKHLKRTQAAYTEWAERPNPGNAASTDSTSSAPPAANGSSSAAYPTPSSSQTPAGPSSSSSSDTAAPVPPNHQPPKPHVLPFVSDPSTSAYAIHITVEHEKPVDELTREEAIAMLKALPQQLEFVPYGAIEALETQQQLEKLTQVEAQVKMSLEVLADKLEAEAGMRLPHDTAPPPIIPKKRTEVYEERFPAEAQPGAGPPGTATSAAKLSVAARAKVTVAGILSSSGIVGGKGNSRKRQRGSTIDESVGDAVEAEDVPERKMKSQKHKRVRKD
ncbi:hypothetical protein LXA43DRAFT_949003 [Ganoderma leucocontextum]|nr:hypothetical protein LXA43DRAFT_949003 [Ganoderma leucocontextum]